MKVKVIGAGLAGSEAAWQLANRGIEVELYEMRPAKKSPALPIIPAISPNWYAPTPFGATGWKMPLVC